MILLLQYVFEFVRQIVLVETELADSMLGEENRIRILGNS